MAKLTWNGDKIIALARKAAKGTLVSIGGDIVRDAKRYAPTGVSGTGGRGIGMGKPEVTPEGRASIAVGFTPEGVYMQYVEGGRRKGKKPPPKGALNLWVERVLGAGRLAGRGARASGTRRGRGSRRMKGKARERDIKSVAFLVGRAISKRGIKPRPMIMRAADTHAGQMPALYKYKFDEAVKEAGLVHS